MNLKALRTLFREEASDNKSTKLWSDTLLNIYANEAQVEACRRARLIVDSTTSEICDVSLEAGDSIFTLDPRVIIVRRVKLATKTLPLGKIHLADLDVLAPGWQAAQATTPCAWCPDFQTGSVVVYPPTAIADAISLTVVREPLETMANDDDEPEIQPRYHPGLANYMLYRAFSKQDSETNDPDKAGKALALFEAEFGKRSSAIDETYIHREHGYDGYDGQF